MVDRDSLARLALFADLDGPELDALAQTLDDERYPRGARVLREGISGNNFYVILDGTASIRIDATERAQLGAGEFFGEVSILAQEPAAADVVAASEELHCAVLPGRELRPLLLRYPPLAVRMLEMGAMRLRSANLWRG
jgi:CRP/FNR family cyclic AMP-dependent transcriptional regulator